MFRQKSKLNNLSARLAWTALINSVLAAAITVTLAVMLFGHFALKQRVQQWMNDVERFAELVAPHVSAFNLSQAESLTDMYVSSQDLTTGAELWHSSGLLITSIGQKDQSQDHPLYTRVDVPVYAPQKSEVIGTLRLWRARISRFEQLQVYLPAIVSVIVVASLLAALMIYHHITQQLARPISELSKKMESYNLRDALISPLKQGSHEIVRLSSIFASMAERIHIQATTDPVTTLHNRFYLDLLISEAERHPQSPCAMILMDLDHFKSINDNYGHDAGDRLLQIVAERIQPILPDNAQFARMGGDEFAIWFTDIADYQRIFQLCLEIPETLTPAITLDNGSTVHLRSSGGLALYPEDVNTPRELLKAADLALYTAKHQRSASIERFDQSMACEAKEWLDIARAIRRSTAQSQLPFHFQVIVDTRSGKVWGHEMLMRLEGEGGQPLNPTQVLKIAAQVDMLSELTRHTVQSGLAFLRQHPYSGCLTINLSAKQLRRFGQAEITRLLAPVEPELRARLVIEMTEQSLLEEQAVYDSVTQIHALGYKIALDDFGRGYSSLSCLNRLPLYMVKLDSSLTQNLLTVKKDYEMFVAIVQVSKSMNLKILAEGIETAEQYRLIRSLNCEYAQGYYIGSPSPEEGHTNQAQLPWACTPTGQRA